MTDKRGKPPSQTTIMRLVAASGGRCQFDGCNRDLFTDKITWAELNNKAVAHIVASSPDGPRGSDKSHELSDKFENLMLLCPTHHIEVDSDTEKFTVEKLTMMKKLQEQRVQQLMDGMDYPIAEILILESPIKGNKEIHVDRMQTIEALRSCQKNPASICPQIWEIKSHGEYAFLSYWQLLTNDLAWKVREMQNNFFHYFPDMILAVFPLAPIPLIAKLGELLSDKREILIFQKTRVPETWCWRTNDITNRISTEVIHNENGDADKIAIIISLTARITLDRILEKYNAGTIYHIFSEKNGVDCISSSEDLRLFWQEYQRVCDCIKNNDHCDSAAVFPAVPVSAAFEIGRRHMPGVHPVLSIYEDDNGFFETVKIGE